MISASEGISAIVGLSPRWRGVARSDGVWEYHLLLRSTRLLRFDEIPSSFCLHPPMSALPPDPVPLPLRVDPPKPTVAQRLKKTRGPVGVVLVVIGKYFAQLYYFILPALKFLPVILKTGGTMLLSIGFYALTWGWRFAVGFVVLLVLGMHYTLLAPPPRPAPMVN
jgi:hypothetical protein